MDAPDVIDIIWPRFQEKFPWAELKYLELHGGLRLERYLSEQAAGVETADIISTNIPEINQLMDGGYVVRVPEVKQYENLYPTGLMDPEGYWTPETAMPVTPIYNSNLVGEAEAPKTWMDMTDSKWKGSIAMPQVNIGQFSFVALTDLYQAWGEEKWTQFIKGLVANEPVIVGSGSDSYQRVVIGEYKLGLNLVNDVLANPDKPVKAAWVDPAPVVLYSNVVVKGSSHPNLAKLFSIWITSADGAESIAETGRVVGAVIDHPNSAAKAMPKGISVAPANTDALVNPEKYQNKFVELGIAK
jgi:iron(III) transport system substrate-binding protein